MVILQESKLAAQLTPPEISGMEKIAQERHFAAGKEIFKEGDAGDGMYVVRDGVVEITVKMGEGIGHVISRIEPGDFFGELAVLDDKARSATATAGTDTTAYFFPRAGIISLVESSPALALTFLREISARLREFNRQYLREVLQAERLAVVGRFARSIIHDLKNPLNNIGLTAELAGVDGLAPETRREAVATIRQQVDRINEMVGEILEFTHGPSQEVLLPPVDYTEFVRRVMEEIQPEAKLRGVTVVIEQEPPSVPLLMNPRRLKRVFHNLIQNAGEAMTAGGKVFLRFSMDKREVITEVEDTGPGVPVEMLGQLFEPFATHGKVHGTGLGLSICKRIVEDHGGWIKAKHEPGRGAIFQFGLPRPPQAAP